MRGEILGVDDLREEFVYGVLEALQRVLVKSAIWNK
jgi:hypothetical protein